LASLIQLAFIVCTAFIMSFANELGGIPFEQKMDDYQWQ